MRDVIEIETERLRLRQMRMSDARRVARFCGDPGVGRMLAMTPLPYLDIAAEGWIMTLSARRPLGRDFVFGVELPGEGLIGAIGAHLRGEEGFDLGYWFGRPYWGRGFATEAAQAFVTQARTLGPLHAGHFVDNPASARVLAKAGFAYTGETRMMFSLARGESVPCKRMRYAAELAVAGARAAAATMH
jgi:RimJ/RimL family protein N-acetyltransferase